MTLRFVDPMAFLLLPVLALLWWSSRRGQVRRSTLGFSDLALLRWARGARPAWEDRVPVALRALALALLVAALARPQAGFAVQEITSRGIDIVIALDTSPSMAAEDLRPNRLEAARDVTARFVRERPADRIGLVAFGGVAVTSCPLTSDHEALLQLIQASQIDMTRVGGTAIGTAIATAVNRLKDLPAATGERRTPSTGSRIILLVTDGRSNTGEIDPLTAARLASSFGIRIYAVGVGMQGPAPITRQTVFGPQVQTIDDDLDEEGLTRIAGATGGRFYRATDNASLAAVIAEINRLEKTERPRQAFVDARELFPWLLAPALALLVLGAVLEETVLREVP